jgi:hypothetical protein
MSWQAGDLSWKSFVQVYEDISQNFRCSACALKKLRLQQYYLVLTNVVPVACKPSVTQALGSQRRNQITESDEIKGKKFKTEVGESCV